MGAGGEEREQSPDFVTVVRGIPQRALRLLMEGLACRDPRSVVHGRPAPGARPRGHCRAGARLTGVTLCLQSPSVPVSAEPQCPVLFSDG